MPVDSSCYVVSDFFSPHEVERLNSGSVAMAGVGEEELTAEQTEKLLQFQVDFDLYSVFNKDFKVS